MQVGVVTLRPRRPSDRAFLRRLFASTRQDEIAELADRGMHPAGFLDLQLRAQDADYHARFPHASFDIIERAGEPVGRLYVNRSVDETRIIDISLLPEWRNRGIGHALLSGLVEQSAAGGRAVTLHVATSSPARRLYERLGFSAIEDAGVHVFMRRSPRPARVPEPGTP